MTGRAHAGKIPAVKDPEPPYTQRRYLPIEIVDWVHECDRIMMRHGRVDGADAYEKRHAARNKAAKLIRFMVEMDLHERWQLVEHTDRKGDYFVWSVEYVGGRNNGRRSRAELDADRTDT
jgi:hypothetical protein